MFAAESDVILKSGGPSILPRIEARFAEPVLVCAGDEDWWFLWVPEGHYLTAFDVQPTPQRGFG